MSKEIEQLGWKAYKKGFFAQWQETSAVLIKSKPDKDKEHLYRKVYKKLNKMRKADV
jgi:hypothetical protein